MQCKIHIVIVLDVILARYPWASVMLEKDLACWHLYFIAAKNDPYLWNRRGLILYWYFIHLLLNHLTSIYLVFILFQIETEEKVRRRLKHFPWSRKNLQICATIVPKVMNMKKKKKEQSPNKCKEDICIYIQLYFRVYSDTKGVRI